MQNLRVKLIFLKRGQEQSLVHEKRTGTVSSVSADAVKNLDYGGLLLLRIFSTFMQFYILISR